MWQLAYVGSVGSQTLVGIPVVWALRTHRAIAHRCVIWPFETGLVTDPTNGRAAAIVHAEIWPSSIDVDLDRHRVKDAAQVIRLSEHLAGLNRRGHLAVAFAPTLDPSIARSVLDEEGWILGAPSVRFGGQHENSLGVRVGFDFAEADAELDDECHSRVDRASGPRRRDSGVDATDDLHHR